MTKQIGNFTITESSDKVVVDYTKSLKDWFDTFVALSIGTFLSVTTYFFLERGLKTTSYIVIGAGLVFAFQAVIQTASSISRFLQPTNNLLVIDKKSKSLRSKHSPFASSTFSVRQIQTLVVSGRKEKVLSGSNRLERTYCTIVAKLKNCEEATLFTINTSRFIRPPAQKLETELYSEAKRLTTELNKHLSLKYQWTGYNEIN